MVVKTLVDKTEMLNRIIQQFDHLPDGPDKTYHMILSAYQEGLDKVEEETRKAIRKETLLEFLELMDRKRTSLSQANMNDLQAIAIGWMGLELTDIWEKEYIMELRPEFLGLVMKHQMWAEEARKEKENASD